MTSFYEPSLETLTRPELGRLQLEKLRRLMEHVQESAFYREKLAKAGVGPGDIRGIEDVERLPFTTKSELVAAQRLDPPYGKIPVYPLDRYVTAFQTSGTSGRPLRWIDTREDWEAWLRCWGYVYRGAGVGEKDVVFGAFSFGPYVSHWSAMIGAAGVGALCVSGGGQSSLQRLQSILDSQCTVVLCTPTYALHLAEVAGQNGIDLRSSAVRTTIHAGEPGASVPNVKRRIEEAWGALAYDHAGATEAGAWGFDCEARTGGIHLNEIEFLFEVIDPEDERPVPEGERGELVITNLGRYGMPVLRYRSGDLVERTDEPCPCGRTLSRIRGGVLGRADDMFIVKGVNLYPSAIDDVMRGVRGIVEYEVEIRRRDGLDDLRVAIETAEDAAFETVAAELTRAFRLRFHLRVEVAAAAPGSLPRYELKARRYKRLSSD